MIQGIISIYPDDIPNNNILLSDNPDEKHIFRQKGNCEDCGYYYDCPRMRGEEICYGYLD